MCMQQPFNTSQPLLMFETERAITISHIVNILFSRGLNGSFGETTAAALER